MGPPGADDPLLDSVARPGPANAPVRSAPIDATPTDDDAAGRATTSMNPWARFAALGDPSAMAAVLSPVVGLEVHAVEVLDVRVQAGERPSRWPAATVGVSYRIVPGDGIAECVVHGTAALVGSGAPGTVEVRDPDGGWVLGLRRFPDDPDLPGLVELYDEHRRADVLGLPTTVEVVRHAVANHVTARLVDPSGRAAAYAKTYRPGRLAAILAGHAAVRDRMPSGSILEPPIGLLADTVLHARADGQVPTAASLADPGAVEIVATAGRLLGLVHGVSLPGSVRDTPTDRRREAGKKARKIAAALPGASTKLAVIAASDEARPDGPLVCLHGDFHPGQLLVDDRGDVTVLDLDSLRWGEPEQDLAEFHVQLHSIGVSPARSRELTDAAIDAYTAATGTLVDRARLEEHASVEWITRAYAMVRRLEPGWPSAVTTWLDRWDPSNLWSG